MDDIESPFGVVRGGFSVDVDDRLVVVSIGSRSQTVNVSTDERRRGVYECRYRLTGVRTLTRDDLEGLATITELTSWLETLGAVQREDPSSARSEVESIAAPPVSDEWVARAREVVESAIDALVVEFMTEPFLHRVEHSVHAQLYAALRRAPELASTHPIGATGRVTQLVHKEWPETVVDRASGSNKRGNFDLAVLAPSQLEHATLDQIRYGRIAAPIVIEMGLNYTLAHLRQDFEKLQASRVPAGYLVHLTRDAAYDPDVEAFIVAAGDDSPIKIAYGHQDGTNPRHKLLNQAGAN